MFVYETKHCVLQSNILDNFCGQSDGSIQYWRLIVSVMCCQAIFMLLFLFAFIEINIKLSSGTSQPPDTNVYCHSSHKGRSYIYYSTLITILFSFSSPAIISFHDLLLSEKHFPSSSSSGDSAVSVGKGVPGAGLLPPPNGPGGALPVARTDDARSLGQHHGPREAGSVSPGICH